MPTAAKEGKCGPTKNRYVFFCNVHFTFYFLITTKPTKVARRPTAANDGQCRSTKANAGQRQPMQVNDGQRRSTTANTGQCMPTAANEGKCGPTKNRYV